MIPTPDCPYCESPLDGPSKHGLHLACNNRFSEELAEWENDVPDGVYSDWEDRMKFSGVLNWQDSEGHSGTIGDFQDVEAESKVAAEKVVLDEFWDVRLDSAGCIPIIVFSEEEDTTLVVEE